MKKVLDPFRFLLIAVAGWMNQAQQQMIEYLTHRHFEWGRLAGGNITAGTTPYGPKTGII